MSKSLKARCIRRWEVEFKGRCDSKLSPCWRKHHLRCYIRECALITADCMIENLAYNNAMHDFLLKTAMTVAGLQSSRSGTTAIVVSSIKKKHRATSMKRPATRRSTKKFRTSWRPGMTERGMIFGGKMVRAILNGGKKQTQRIMKKQPAKLPSSDNVLILDMYSGNHASFRNNP